MGGGGQGSDSCVVLPLHELHELLYFENVREKTKPTCTYAMMQQLPFLDKGRRMRPQIEKEERGRETEEGWKSRG